MKIQRIVLLVSLFLLSACGNYTEKKKDVEQPNFVFSKSELSFALVSSQVLGPNCVECHKSYKSYDVVRKDLDKIMFSIETNKMPKRGGPLSDDLKSLMRAWYSAGAPNKPGEPPTPPPTDKPVELAPTYASLSANVFEPKCIVCHNPDGEAKFLDLSSRFAIFSARDRIFDGDKHLLNFENPAESYIIDVITDEDEPMPPEWTDITPLTEKEVNTMIEWIGLGLP
ncbi:MAG: hypothetical protein KDD25_02035 [Bdellovibrionales bacterium]|nr:hypothetical protein [Bdellovibrionales bacterium]